MKITPEIQELIYELRHDKFLTFLDISKEIKKLGVEVSISTVRKNYIRISNEKKGIIYKKSTRKGKKLLKIPLERIKELRDENRTYPEIAEIFQKEGINVSRETIRSRCIEIYGEKKKIPKSKRRSTREENFTNYKAYKKNSNKKSKEDINYLDDQLQKLIYTREEVNLLLESFQDLEIKKITKKDDKYEIEK